MNWLSAVSCGVVISAFGVGQDGLTPPLSAALADFAHERTLTLSQYGVILGQAVLITPAGHAVTPGEVAFLPNGEPRKQLRASYTTVKEIPVLIEAFDPVTDLALIRIPVSLNKPVASIEFAESAMEYVQLCEKHDFRNIVISLKASRVPIMLAANRLIANRMAEDEMRYPLHLGVTEAGDGEYARIKSVSGIGTLLAEGIGSTIRVSLAEDPLNEIPVCYDILQALGLRRTKTEFIACPSCGRTKFDLPTVFREVKEATSHLTGLDIAVMGCIVNGPGEMADADYGYVGKAGGMIALYRGRELVRNNIPQERGVEELIRLLKEDGVWVEPERIEAEAPWG